MADEPASTPLSATAAVVRNPLSVIAMFVLLVEAIATITLIEVRETLQIAEPLVWFVVFFPAAIAFLFFGTIWWRHQFLYSPMEYRSDESFLTAMQRLQRVEARQEAATINPQTADEAQSMQVVDRLLRLQDVRAAVKVGRTFLEAGQFEIAGRIFAHILDRTPTAHEDRYNALANLAYAEIGQKKFESAIRRLNAVIGLIGEDAAGPWHHLALAYAHKRLSQADNDDHDAEFQKRLALGKRRLSPASRAFYKKLYPEIAAHF